MVGLALGWTQQRPDDRASRIAHKDRRDEFSSRDAVVAGVDRSGPHKGDGMKILGTVVDTESKVVTGCRVVAYHGDVNLKKEKRLGGATTNKNGAFAIKVDLAHYPLGVNVRVAVRKGSKELWSSPVHYNTQADLVVDATIPEAALGVSEYQGLTEKVSPLLQGEKLARLLPTQIEYLAGRSGIEQALLNQLVAAARLHGVLVQISEESAYGVLRQGLPGNAGDLVARSASEWKAALEAAGRGNVITPLSRVRLAATIDALSARKAAESLHSSSPAGVGAASFAAVALGKNGKAQKIAVLAARHDGADGGFWRAVSRDRSLSEAEREKLRNYAAVSEIVGGDPDVLRQVAAHLHRGGQQVTPAALVTIKPAKFQDMIEAAGRANPNSLLAAVGAEQFKTYASASAEAIANRVAAAFPTEALLTELKAFAAEQVLQSVQERPRDVPRRDGGFDLRDGWFGGLDGRNGASRFRGIPDKDAVKERLATMTRLYRVLPDREASVALTPGSLPLGSFATIAALADKGYDSSSAISATPKAEFLADVSAKREDDEYWSQVHERATAVREVAWLKGIDLLHSYRQPFHVIKSLQDEPAVRAGVADLRTLFGSLDICDCEACASITSPAAYLADVLNFLGTDVATAQVSPYRALIERRPDIPHILLNCDNTNRALPYIDLVNELLEDEVLRKAGVDPVWVAVPRSEAAGVEADLSRWCRVGSSVAAVPARKVLVQALNQQLPGYGFDADTEVSVVTRDKQAGTGWHVSGTAGSSS